MLTPEISEKTANPLDRPELFSRAMHPRLSFVIYSLECGGAERVLSTMANYWAERGWEITVVTLKGRENAPFFPLHPAIRWLPLGVAGNSRPSFLSAIGSNTRRVLALRRAIRSSCPDAVISFVDVVNVLTLLACRGLDVPVIVSERTNPSERKLGVVWSFLRRCSYSKASALVVQTQVARMYFPERVRARCEIIPNPVLVPARTGEIRPKGSRQIIAVGRLVATKGFDLLLKAFAPLAERFPEWTLVIRGEGPARAELQQLCQELKISARTHLPGRSEDMERAFQEAELFVLSSRFEGFPNALCEAMARGLAVVSFALPGGPTELVQNGVNGLLVPPGDIDALRNALERLMSDDGARARLGLEAEKITEKYPLDRVMDSWERLLWTRAARAGASKAMFESQLGAT